MKNIRAVNVTILLRIKIVLGCSIRTMLETTKAIDVSRTKPILQPCMYITCIASPFSAPAFSQRTDSVPFSTSSSVYLFAMAFLLPFLLFSSSYSSGSRRVYALFSQVTKCLPILSLKRTGLLRLFTVRASFTSRERGEKIKTTSRKLRVCKSWRRASRACSID